MCAIAQILLNTFNLLTACIVTYSDVFKCVCHNQIKNKRLIGPSVIRWHVPPNQVDSRLHPVVGESASILEVLPFYGVLHCKCRPTTRCAAKCLKKFKNKKAVQSQRRPRNAPYTWCPENFRDSLTTPTATIPNIFHGLLF